MRAYQLPKGGAGIDALTKVERPKPSPGHRQVLVKVAACSLNFRDLGIVRGTYRMPVASDNIIPLSDGAGEVVEVGSGVTRVKVGDKVAGNFFQRWPGGEPPPDVQSTALGGGIDGMLAEYVVLEEEGAVKIPAHLSLEEGATLPCAGVTVWHAMMEHGRMIAGQTVLLQGTGGVSVFGLQFAHAMGMQADHHLVERRQARQGQEARRQPHHQLQDHAGLGEGRGGVHRRPRRRSRRRGRRRRHVREVVRRDPRRRQDQHDRQPQRSGDRIQSGPDHGQARQPSGHLGRLDADVRGDEPHDRGERDQAGDRQGVRLRRGEGGLPAHGFGRALRQDRDPGRAERISRRGGRTACARCRR